MSSSESETRASIVEIAKTWLRTPFHDNARLKGVGVDCAMLLAEVFLEAGVVDEVEVGAYSAQWHMHRDEERFLEFVKRYADEVTDREPLPGDVVLFQFARLYSHGAIVVEWPRIIHARLGGGVEYDDAIANKWLAQIGEGYENPAPPRPRKLFSIRGVAGE